MILTVGDSFTYGEELANRTVQAWPYLLSTALKKEVLNLGRGGGSPEYIFRTTVHETVKQKFDIVIVGWSNISRFETMDFCVNPNTKRNVSWIENYYKYSYNTELALSKWLAQALALQEYLKAINQPYLFCNTGGQVGGELTDEFADKFAYILNKFDKNFYVDWPMGFTEWMGDCPKGPGGHPLELGHQRIAEKINEHIRNLGWVS